MFGGGTTKLQYTTHRGKSASLMGRYPDVQRAIRVQVQGLQKGGLIFFCWSLAANRNGSRPESLLIDLAAWMLTAVGLERRPGFLPINRCLNVYNLAGCRCVRLDPGAWRSYLFFTKVMLAEIFHPG